MPKGNTRAKFSKMPVYLTGRGAANLVSIQDLSYDNEERAIVLRASNGDEILLDCPVKCPDGFGAEKYTLHLFRNKFIVESNVFEIHLRERGKRIGWLMPIASLESLEHGFSTSSHFLNYARAAIYKLIKTEKDIFPLVANSFSTLAKIKLTDFYPEDTAILVLSDEALSKEPGFLINHYAHAFFGYGYADFDTADHPADQGSRIKSNFDQIGKRLIIKPLSACLIGNAYVSSIMGGAVNLRAHPLTQFLSLYQIFELLIERVFLNEKQIAGIKITAGSSATEIRDAVGQIQNALSEEGRLNKLWSRAYLENMPEIGNLNAACAKLLKKINREVKGGFVADFYKVRNAVVHDYRSVFGLADRELEEINSELMAILPEILTNYKEVCPLAEIAPATLVVSPLPAAAVATADSGRNSSGNFISRITSLAQRAKDLLKKLGS